MRRRNFFFGPLLIVAAAFCSHAAGQDVQLLNVSYDPTRELYREFNGGTFDRLYQPSSGR
jgi:sulfate/thiosulfate transport system substrate-binding protein